LPTSGRKIGRILADLEDQLVEEGLLEDQADKLVDAIESKIDKWLDAESDNGDETDDLDEKSG